MSELEGSEFFNSFYSSYFSSPLDDFSPEPIIPLDIFTASNIGSYECVYNLIVKKPHLASAKNRENWNALMYATRNGHQNIVYLLLEQNAPLHACNGEGRNVLMIASSMGNKILVEQFLNYGSNIESRDIKDWTPLFYAVDNESLEVVQILLKYGANPNALVRYTGKTPLIVAAYTGNDLLVKVLLNSGAYLDTKDCFGKDALSYAVEASHERVIALMQSCSSKDEMNRFDFCKSVEAEEKCASSSSHFQLRPVNPAGKEGIYSTYTPSLEDLLMQYGLSSYIPMFEENAVDLVIFLGLSDKDLKECGVSELGSRQKMLNIISKWHHNALLTRRTPMSSYEIKLLIEIQELREQLSECKQSRQDCESVIVELRKRLQECRNRSYILRDHLLQTLHQVLPMAKVAEVFSHIFSYFDDFTHLASEVGSDFHLRD